MTGDVAQNLKEELGEILFGEGDGCSAVFEDEDKLFVLDFSTKRGTETTC